MKIKKQTFAVAIALALVLTIAATFITCLPTANAVAVPDRDTRSIIDINPKLSGLGQELTVNIMVYPPPSGPTYYAQDVGGYLIKNITVTFTRPDGSKDTFMPTDIASGSGTTGGGTRAAGVMTALATLTFFYKPNMVGNWSAVATFPGQTFTTGPSPDTVYYKPSSSAAVTFMVQQDPVDAGLLTGWPYSPLPTEYWERPISVNNREWYEISGDWMSYHNDAWATSFNPYSTAPNAPHIVWKKEVATGGIIGGQWGSYSYGGGGWRPTIVMDGKLYCTGLVRGTFDCVDLRTGNLLYTASGDLWTGWHSETGAKSLWEVGTTAWKRYDPDTGAVLQTLTNSPDNMEPVMAGRGILKFVDGNPVVYLTQRWGFNTTLPLKYAGEYLIKWDYSKVKGNNWQTGVVWNVSIRQPDGVGVGDGRQVVDCYRFDEANVVIAKAHDGENIMMGFDATTGAYLYRTTWTGWVDISSGSVGSFRAGPKGPILLFDTVLCGYHAFDVKTGEEIWQSAKIGEGPWASLHSYPDFCIAYGNLYVGSADGHVYAVDLTDGTIKWKSDYTGDTGETIYGTFPFLGGGVAADGKVYFDTRYPTSTNPDMRFQKTFCIDAYTGKFLWNISSAIIAGGTRVGSAIAEGYLIGTSEDNGIMYAIGKGQTATSVSVQNDVVALGSSVLIKGSVLDQSPAQAGTPAVADESMSEWMDYLHMQNATLINNPPMPRGVPVTLWAVDPNGNTQEIGTVTSDGSGLFKKLWTPEIPGEFTVYATFAGSESYWGSYAATAVGVTAAPEATPGPEAPVDNTPMLTGITAAVIVAIIICVITLILVLRKR